ncbi:MAG TPA: zinc ribbon domain-containing protein [Armatimonadota bacterium]|nr:zinc ribbon domain-containing protein [Armatimonadota bacterium]
MYCIACKSNITPAGARYCARCGAPMQTPLWSENPPASTAPQQEPGGKTVSCTHCGKANPDNYRYCIYCGAQLTGEERTETTNPEDRNRAAGLVKQARQEWNCGRQARARALCEEALSLDQSNAEAHALHAEVLNAEGSIAGALQEMILAGRYDPRNQEYERRLRELRSAQEQSIAPLLRDLHPRAPRRFGRVRRRQRPPQSLRRASWSSPKLPDWVQAAAIIIGLMLLLWLIPRVIGGTMQILGLLISVLAAVWVFQDCRASGKTTPVALLWGAIVLFTNLIGLLVYLLVTRARR